jgi:hypothetical protein
LEQKIVRCEPGFYPVSEPDLFVADEDVDPPMDLHLECFQGQIQATILPLDKEIA